MKQEKLHIINQKVLKEILADMKKDKLVVYWVTLERTSNNQKLEAAGHLIYNPISQKNKEFFKHIIELFEKEINLLKNNLSQL